MKYEFHPEAEQELSVAALRYESEVAGLGLRFGVEVERALSIIIEYPEIGARIDGNLRHFVLQRFPFSVVYAVLDSIVYVIALAHNKREPEYWRLRVQDR